MTWVRSFLRLTLACAWCAGLPARAADLLLYTPEGPPTAGGDALLEVVVSETGRPVLDRAPTLLAPAGLQVSVPRDAGPGRWRYRVEAPDRVGVFTIRAVRGQDTTELELDVVAAPGPGLRLGPPPEAVAGQQTALEISVFAADLPPAEEIQVGVPEGEVTGIRLGDGSLTVLWRPGPDPFPRAVPIAVRDGRRPDAPPAVVVARLRARPRIPIQTEPGARVTLSIGGRVHGPFTAGADGVAMARATVRPGDRIADVVIEDIAGNTQRSTLALGGDPRPGLVALTEASLVAGEDGPAVHLYGVRPDGRPWSGSPPQCATSLGEALSPESTGIGRWRVILPRISDDAFFDLRVDCHLEHRARASVRVPVTTGMPTGLYVRSFPAELDAERPNAQLQAHLENRRGDRLPADGIVLTAARGQVVATGAEGGQRAAMRAEYHGGPAVASGSDRVTAVWRRPPGVGSPRALVVSADRRAPTAVVHARVLDRQGRPLLDQPVRLGADGLSVEVRTGSDGWATAVLPGLPPAEIVLVEARAGDLVRRIAAFPQSDFGPPVGAPDLTTELDIAIRSGRVREVFLSTEPKTLVVGAGERARVTLRLVDKDGNPVPDESIALSASDGTLSPPTRGADGAYEATWTPGTNTRDGTVEITASSHAAAFAATTTEIQVEPAQVRRAPGVHLGWLQGVGGISSPYFAIQADLGLQREGALLYGRLGAGFYTEQAQTTDSATGDEVTLDLALIPISAGVLARQERGRFGVWFGSSLVAVPYRLQVQYGDEVPTRGPGVAPPGFEIFSGVGLRQRSGEVTVQVAYLFAAMTAEDVGWQGQVGGALATVGYRLIY